MHSITFKNIDELSDCLNKNHAEIALRKLSDTKSHMDLTTFGNIHFFKHLIPFELHMYGGIPGDYYSVFLPLDGSVVGNGKTFHGNSMSLIHPGKEFTNYSHGPFTVCTLCIPKKLLEDFLLSQNENFKFPPSAMMDVDFQKMHKLKSLLKEMSTGLKLQPTLIDQEKAVKSMQNQLLQTMGEILLPTPNTFLENTKIDSLASALKSMDSHLSDHFGVAEIARELNISRRSLQTLFTDYFGLSPLKFINLRRMNLVREALRHCDPGSTSIANIAAQHGFWHLGRFAGNYRELFGELPSETISRKDSSSHAIQSLKNITDNFFFR